MKDLSNKEIRELEEKTTMKRLYKERMERYLGVLECLLTEMPPERLQRWPGYMSDKEYLMLQDFCASHAKKECFTGHGIIMLAEDAVTRMNL
jgi:hypothetical protein